MNRPRARCRAFDVSCRPRLASRAGMAAQGKRSRYPMTRSWTRSPVWPVPPPEALGLDSTEAILLHSRKSSVDNTKAQLVYSRLADTPILEYLHLEVLSC